jgi:hypothetical protein
MHLLCVQLVQAVRQNNVQGTSLPNEDVQGQLARMSWTCSLCCAFQHCCAPAAGCPSCSRFSASSRYCDCCEVVLFDRNPGKISTGLLLLLLLLVPLLVASAACNLRTRCFFACDRCLLVQDVCKQVLLLCCISTLLCIVLVVRGVVQYASTGAFQIMLGHIAVGWAHARAFCMYA